MEKYFSEKFFGFNKRKENKKIKPLPDDLKRLVLKRSDYLKRLKGLEYDINLKMSDSGIRYILDPDELTKYKLKYQELAEQIFDLCLKHGEDPLRFLSSEEIERLRSATKTKEKAD